MDPSDLRFVAVQELTAYWLRHPYASDTLEGIQQWWLVGTSQAAPVIEQALAWLVQCGVVGTHRAADGRVHYRLNDATGSGPC